MRRLHIDHQNQININQKLLTVNIINAILLSNFFKSHIKSQLDLNSAFADTKRRGISENNVMLSHAYSFFMNAGKTFDQACTR